jgi:tight adherence protein B
VDAYTYALWILGFLGVVLFLEGLFVLWNGKHGPEARRLRKRLEVHSAESRPQPTIVKSDKLSSNPDFDRLLKRIPGVDRLHLFLKQAGMGESLPGFVIATLVSALVGLVAALALRPGVLVSLPLVVVAALLPVGYVGRTRRLRLLQINEQLPDMLDLLARAMRAGHAFSSALQMAADEMPEPCASEVRTTFEEVNFGVPVATALLNLAQRVPSADLRYFAVAVSIQRETGGNLAELLGSIATLIRARFRFVRSVRTLTAEGRLSAWILVLLPFALAAVISIVNHEFIRVLWTDPVGIKMLWCALALMGFGIFWMSRLVKVRV